MKFVWAPEAWADYQYWCRTDVRVRDKINTLIDDIQRNLFTGLGKPEPLKRNLAGWWSRRVTREHRLVYRIKGGELQIAQCRFHYFRCIASRSSDSHEKAGASRPFCMRLSRRRAGQPKFTCIR